MSNFGPEQVNALLESAGRGAAIYLIGAGGCGVSGLGHLLLDLGFRVCGSDAVEGDEVRRLRARGAVIHAGHDAEPLRAAAPALAVYSSAIRADNVEVQTARELSIPIVRRATVLAALVQRQSGICVAGMHGKTTTSALLAFALERLGAAPSYAVGAAVPQLGVHARFRAGPPESRETLSQEAKPARPFVVEVDESDGTLCEFHPSHAVILNVDEEHLDYFANVQAVCREFEQFAASARGHVVFCADDSRLLELLARHPRGISYGFHASADYRIERLEAPANGIPTNAPVPASRFAVSHRGAVLGKFSLSLLGEKNVSNATAVIALLHALGHAPAAIAAAVADFRGAARRQQELFAGEDVRVFDDYAHHPNEIRATLSAFRALGARRLVVAFQPHRYTRTQHLMQQFAGSFAGADRLFLTDVYAASEPEISGATSAALAGAIRGCGQAVDYVPALKDARAAVLAAVQPGDLVLFLGAGDITKVAHEVAASLREQPARQNRADSPALATAPERREAGLAARLREVLSPATFLRENEPLSRRTTLRVGGHADVYVEPASEADLAHVLRVCAELARPFFIIGRGSNLLVRDGGIRGAVICLTHEAFSRVQLTGAHLHCGAGAKLKAVAVEARRAGLAGLEFLEGIPGSVGGALRMNAGAMGSWMFEIVEQIRFMDFAGTIHERKASEVNVEYRGCPLFKSHIALGAVLRGTPAPKEVIAGRAQAFSEKRWESQPAQPSAGCIFKNPATVPAGKLIDELGLKGARRGGAMVSTVHGNFIVNEGNATAADVLELIDFIKQTAKSKRGIELQTEVEIVGE